MFSHIIKSEKLRFVRFLRSEFPSQQWEKILLVPFRGLQKNSRTCFTRCLLKSKAFPSERYDSKRRIDSWFVRSLRARDRATLFRVYSTLSLLSSPFSSVFHSLLSFSSAFSSPSPPILRSPLFASSFPSPNDRAHKLVRYLGIILNIVDRTMAFQSRETRLTFTCNYLSRHAVPRNAITPQANRMPLSSGWKKKRVCVESKYRSISLGSNRNPRFLEVSFFLFFRTFVPHPPLTFTTRISFDSIRIYPDSRSFASINSV